MLQYSTLTQNHGQNANRSQRRQQRRRGRTQVIGALGDGDGVGGDGGGQQRHRVASGGDGGGGGRQVETKFLKRAHLLQKLELGALL